MTVETREFLKENTNALVNAPSCSEEAKAAGEKMLSALGTDAEDEGLKVFVSELQEDVQPLESVLAWAQSADGISILGEDYAKSFAKGLEESKAKGGKYCICPACTAGGKILARFAS